MDVDEGDAPAAESSERPAQQRQRLLRRPPDGDVEQRAGAGLVAAQERARSAVDELVPGRAGRRRRAQDLHSRTTDGSASSPQPLSPAPLPYTERRAVKPRSPTNRGLNAAGAFVRVACAGAGPTKRTEVVRKSAKCLVVAPTGQKKPFFCGSSMRKLEEAKNMLGSMESTRARGEHMRLIYPAYFPL